MSFFFPRDGRKECFMDKSGKLYQFVSFEQEISLIESNKSKAVQHCVAALSLTFMCHITFGKKRLMTYNKYLKK